MDMHVNQSATESDWSEKFTRLSHSRRVKLLDHAVRLIVNPQTDPGEREMSILQIQAALAVDPGLVFNVITFVQTNESSDTDIERLKEEAAMAQSNFNGLVNATQTLRASLTEIGGMAMKDRLPETVQEWKETIAKLVERETHQLVAREARLIQQQKELEAKRAEILADIDIAQNLSRINIPSLDEKTSSLINQIGGEITGLFQHEISKIVAGAADDVKGLIMKRFVSLTDQTEARIAEAKGTIASLSFAFDQAESYEVGQLVRGKGIYAGIWEPKDREGNPLGKKYHAFAAPEDLTDSSGVKTLLTFKNAAKEVGKKKGWHQHNGLIVPDRIINNGYEAYLYEVLKKSDTYKGEWFIPPRDLLHGRDVDGNEVQSENNLYALKDTGDFSGTFTTTTGSGTAHWYWSSSEDREDSDYVWNVDVTDGVVGWLLKGNRRLSCRPVRVELAL